MFIILGFFAFMSIVTGIVLYEEGGFTYETILSIIFAIICITLMPVLYRFSRSQKERIENLKKNGSKVSGTIVNVNRSVFYTPNLQSIVVEYVCPFANKKKKAIGRSISRRLLYRLKKGDNVDIYLDPADQKFMYIDGIGIACPPLQDL